VVAGVGSVVFVCVFGWLVFALGWGAEAEMSGVKKQGRVCVLRFLSPCDTVPVEVAEVEVEGKR
jgi:hypothetical protein